MIGTAKRDSKDNIMSPGPNAYDTRPKSRSNGAIFGSSTRNGAGPKNTTPGPG